MRGSKIFFDRIELEEGIFSSVEFGVTQIDFVNFVQRMNFPQVFSESFIDEEGNLKYKNLVLKTQQNFYVDISTDDKLNTLLTIYYKENQSQELKFFINNLKKQSKNVTINNRPTQTKN